MTTPEEATRNDDPWPKREGHPGSGDGATMPPPPSTPSGSPPPRRHQPPYDGSPLCPACPVEVRGLHATAHNAVGAFEAAAKGHGDWSRVYRKMAELAEAVGDFQPVMDGHFARAAHSHGDLRP